MWNYIVLGQVPGTNYYLNFTSVIILYAVVILLLAIIITRIRQPRREPNKTFNFDVVQLSLLDSLPQHHSASAENRLIAVYLAVAIAVIMKLSQLQRVRLKRQLSLYIER